MGSNPSIPTLSHANDDSMMNIICSDYSILGTSSSEYAWDIFCRLILLNT